MQLTPTIFLLQNNYLFFIYKSLFASVEDEDISGKFLQANNYFPGLKDSENSPEKKINDFVFFIIILRNVVNYRISGFSSTDSRLY